MCDWGWHTLTEHELRGLDRNLEVAMKVKCGRPVGSVNDPIRSYAADEFVPVYWNA
jgi:hypothetical protein